MAPERIPTTNWSQLFIKFNKKMTKISRRRISENP
jgi:hypothetical protein